GYDDAPTRAIFLHRFRDVSDHHIYDAIVESTIRHELIHADNPITDITGEWMAYAGQAATAYEPYDHLLHIVHFLPNYPEDKRYDVPVVASDATRIWVAGDRMVKDLIRGLIARGQLPEILQLAPMVDTILDLDAKKKMLSGKEAHHM